MANTQFATYAPIIRSLTVSELQGSASLVEKLLIAKDGPIKVCYAPFEFVNPMAKVVIVGITPGRTQMLNALRECRAQLDKGADDLTALYAAKQTGAFSGTMRPNLIALLDSVGVNRWLGISSCTELFDVRSELVQTTSVLRNPVFVNDENYNGTPSMTTHPLLQQQLIEGFGEDARELPDAIYIPLGEKVAQALSYLAERGFISKDRILSGMPHPSGANAERIAYFLGNKSRASLSAKTSSDKLDAAKQELLERVANLA